LVIAIWCIFMNSPYNPRRASIVSVPSGRGVPLAAVVRKKTSAGSTPGSRSLRGKEQM